MIVRGAFNHLLRPGLRSDFRDNILDWEEEWSRIVMSGTLDRAELEAVMIAGLPRLVLRGEAEAVTLIDPKLSDKTTFYDDEFALGFAISKKMMEDDLYGKANSNAKWLGKSVNLSLEYNTAAMLDDAFSGSTFTGYGAEALISATHTLLNASGTWNNLITGNPQLGIVGLQAAFETAESTVDPNGDPMPVRIDTLIINITDEWAAIQLTQNPQEPYTADRNINALRRKKQLGYVVSHYKSQTGHDWFAKDSVMSDMHKLFKTRPEFIDWYDEATLSSMYAARMRTLDYFYDQRGWIGSDAA